MLNVILQVSKRAPHLFLNAPGVQSVGEKITPWKKRCKCSTLLGLQLKRVPLDSRLVSMMLTTTCCLWLACSPPASEAALWALQHRVQLRTDVGPDLWPADRPLSLHLADEQRAHARLRARRGPADHAESRLAHQRTAAAAEAPPLLRAGQRHGLRRVGAAPQHEEGREGHRVQHAPTGGGQLPSRAHLRHHGGQDELLRHGLQEGDGERQVSQMSITYFVPVVLASQRSTAALPIVRSVLSRFCSRL